jgi:hypothetical protein
MDDRSKLDLEAALKVIEVLLREQLKTSGRLPETIVTVGGTALAALRIRERSDGVDLYMSEIDDTAIDTVTKKYRAQYGFNFKIDATPGNTIWGSFAIDDIDQSTSFNLQVSISEATVAQCPAPPSEPTNNALSVERDRADGALDSVVVELDAAVIDEALQPSPARQGVVNSFHLGFHRWNSRGLSQEKRHTF